MTQHEYDIEDVEYLRHGDKPLLARIYRPRGPGPFPAIVDVHGGAWCLFDRLRGTPQHEALARRGVVVVAPDFRLGREGAYPLSVADVHYGVRWTKSHAAQLKTRPELVGIAGQSSGGHLAMLVAMRPHDPRYAAIPLPAGLQPQDATVRCVVMLWPVINPLGRYHNAQRRSLEADPPAWAASIIEHHHQYWQTEANMEEGNPMLALERGEKLLTPPAMWIQATQDEVHSYRDAGVSALPEPERFAENYRRGGGEIAVEYFEAPNLFITEHPTMPASLAAMQVMVDFVARSIAPAGTAGNG